MIRKATMADYEQIVALENNCFNEAEAASASALKERLEAFKESFFVLEEEGKIIGMINGCVCDSKYIEDRFYETTNDHDDSLPYQHVFGLDVLDTHRKKGHGGALLKYMVDSAKARNKAGVVLTCKKEKLHFYESRGFECLGVSASVHGNVVWYDMFCDLTK